MKIEKYEDLKMWNVGHELTLKVYSITKLFPKDELYGLVSQLRRASSSVPTNIVEGYYRNTTKELIQFLYNARGSAGEVTYLLLLSKELKYISDDVYLDLRQKYEGLLKSISAVIRGLEKRLK